MCTRRLVAEKKKIHSHSCERIVHNGRGEIMECVTMSNGWEYVEGRIVSVSLSRISWQDHISIPAMKSLMKGDEEEEVVEASVTDHGTVAKTARELFFKGH